MAFMYNVTGSENADNTKYTQVYQATHKGENYLPFMNRSFISFSYGKKRIEDFNLIATVSGDRMQRDATASFNDLTTSYDTLPGQFYWGTYYKTNSLQLTLSTDSMSQRQLDDFVYWFAAGEVRELVLAEHPNRAIMARISEPPRINMLPFEKKITVTLGSAKYDTSTTEYKGDISLNFVMDDPFWYSLINIFGEADDDLVYHDTWIDANGNERSVYEDPDAIKIAYEDGIPFASMIHDSMMFGGETYANVEYDDCSRIATMTYSPSENDLSNIWENKYNELIQGGASVAEAAEGANNYFINHPCVEQYSKGAVIAADTAENGVKQTIHINSDMMITSYETSEQFWTGSGYVEVKITYEQWVRAGADLAVGLIAGPMMAGGDGVVNLGPNASGAGNSNNNTYFYYAGTAPSPTTLTFTLTPSTSGYYVSCPQNKYAHSTLNDHEYNTITVECETKQELQFTTCNLYTSYNQAMEIFIKANAGDSVESVRELIRDNVHHAAVRKWANTILDSVTYDSEVINTNLEDNPYAVTLTENMLTKAKIYLELMIKKKAPTMNEINSSSNAFLPGTYTFNSKTGEAIGILTYRVVPESATLPTTDNGWANFGNVVNQEEDVGDMLKSNYLILRERNKPDDLTGNIVAWSSDNKKTSYRLYHDVENGLNNIKIKYDNLYL